MLYDVSGMESAPLEMSTKKQAMVLADETTNEIRMSCATNGHGLHESG